MSKRKSDLNKEGATAAGVTVPDKKAEEVKVEPSKDVSGVGKVASIDNV